MSKENIDFVMIWVDGNDEEWKKEKRKYTPSANSDDEDNRYREWDNLKYWFRGVEKFTPWVHKIHFVTCGHLPAWLNVNHPKLNLVSHKDYMKEEYLPTFSSHPIELNLHRIQGLSEKFVYFNDDTFITKPMTETDFFRNGLPCSACGFEVINIKYEPVYYDVMINNMRMINKEFDSAAFIRKNFFKIFNLHYDAKHIKSLLLLPWSIGFIPGFINPHLPNAYLKSTFEEVWEKEYELLDETSKHKFRCGQDVNQYIFRYWQFMTGKFSPINMKKQGAFYYIGKQFEECCSAIKEQKHKMICVNDDLPQISLKEFERHRDNLNLAFDTILPQKSQFERR